MSNNTRIDHGFTYDNASGANTFTNNSIRDFTSYPPQVGAGDVNSLVNGGNTFTNVTNGAPVNVLGDTIATDATWVATLSATQISYKVVSGVVIVQGVDGADFVTTLTLPPGTVMKFMTTTGLDIAPTVTAGALIADGTALNPVLLTSGQTVKARGDWYGLFLAPATGKTCR